MEHNPLPINDYKIQRPKCAIHLIMYNIGLRVLQFFLLIGVNTRSVATHATDDIRKRVNCKICSNVCHLSA